MFEYFKKISYWKGLLIGELALLVALYLTLFISLISMIIASLICAGLVISIWAWPLILYIVRHTN